MIEKSRNMVTEYLYTFYDKGLMDSYSPDHILIRAMSQDPDVFSQYSHLFDTRFVDLSTNIPLTFISNLSTRLRQCANVFTTDSIDTFVRDQLSAGKKNYSDATFFEALSEINVLFYLSMFSDNIKTATYEPRQKAGGTNPEARFIFHDDTELNVEVKKGNFTSAIDRKKGRNGAIKPNIALQEGVKESLQSFCNKNDLQLVYPRISKVGDFVASAGKKFIFPKSSRHFNVLFINWTYTDFPECGVNEPLSIFINTENGLFYNRNALSMIKNKEGENIITESDIDKLSAVVVYRDTLETLLSGDFRFHFRNNSFKFILNLLNKNQDIKRLSSILHMNPCNNNYVSEWYPLDYNMVINSPKNLLEDAKNILLKDSVVLENI